MNQVIVVAGPTAVGKTEYTIDIANKLNGEIVSCDSMQLYKYMDIGSAKPTEGELELCKHYLIGEIDPSSDFSVAKYQKLATDAINTILNKNKTPILEGGTGLYLNSILYDMDFSNFSTDSNLRAKLQNYATEYGNNALHNKLKELDENAAKEIHPNNTKKIIRAIERLEHGSKIIPFSQCKKTNPNYSFKMICLNRDRKELYNRINHRVDKIVEEGLIDEVINLQEMGLGENNISMKGIGYKEIIDYLSGKYPLDEAIDLIKKNTRHFAKRQLTWFRRYDDMKWFNLSNYDTKKEAIKDIMEYLK